MIILPKTQSNTDLVISLFPSFHLFSYCGLLQLHKTVKEDLKDRSSLKVCNNQKNQKLDSDTMLSSEKENTKMEKMPKEMNAMKLKNEISSDILEPSSFKRIPDMVPSMS
uniref:Uncharacterized protein n=1 Tax=Chenopodium quinoa TaxID=63459 RepID=A0A803MGN7_CHEQI